MKEEVEYPQFLTNLDSQLPLIGLLCPANKIKTI